MINKIEKFILKRTIESIAIASFIAWPLCDYIGEKSIGRKDKQEIVNEMREYNNSNLLNKIGRIGRYVGLKYNLAKAERSRD